MAALTVKQKLALALNPGKTLAEILTEALEAHRSEVDLVKNAGESVKPPLSKGTMAAWCREYDIDTEQYKKALADVR